MCEYSDYIENILYSFAVGDAFGMATEFMTREFISEKFGLVKEFLPASLSFIHKDLNTGQITDDTEQTIFLLERYISDGHISPENTAGALLDWMESTDAVAKGYIGPNSLKALADVRAGMDVRFAGKNGTTCGSSMRILAPVLFKGKCTDRELISAVIDCGIPTHDTNLAMEGAMALGFAFNAAISGKAMDKIIDCSIEGAEIGRKSSVNEFVGPSAARRIENIKREICNVKNNTDLMDYLYYVFGTTMETYDVVPAAVAIFAFTGGDVWESIRIGASVGGDTDTIAAITGGLCAAYSRSNNIPADILEFTEKRNNLKKRVKTISENLSEIWRANRG